MRKEKRLYLKKIVFISLLYGLTFPFLIGGNVFAAPFDSGSTGADGTFAPAADVTVPLPPDGVFNYTTVDIPAGVTVTYSSNLINTPVTILANGNVTIDGIIDVNGKDGTPANGPLTFPIGPGGKGGPGGFDGGAGGIAPPFNNGTVLSSGIGLGPGGAPGGTYNSSLNRTETATGGSFGTQGAGPRQDAASIYRDVTLLPLIGGSGGGGSAASQSTSTTCQNGCNGGGGGGGGGGAILIASSGTITINGSVTSNGGDGGLGFSSPTINATGGGGSGGAIRLIANTIAGAGTITATGGSGLTGWVGGDGRIRVESNTLSFTGTTDPTASFSAPGIVSFTSLPTLTITDVGGVSVPGVPGGSFESPDVTLASSTVNPVTVNIAATNIPVSTVVVVVVKGRNADATLFLSSNSLGRKFNSTPLSGTQANSTASASVNLVTDSVNMISVETTFPIALASLDFPTFVLGEKVENIKLAAAFGGESSIFLITESGKEIPFESKTN